MVKKYSQKKGIKKSYWFSHIKTHYTTWLYIKTHDIEVVRQHLRHKAFHQLQYILRQHGSLKVIRHLMDLSFNFW